MNTPKTPAASHSGQAAAALGSMVVYALGSLAIVGVAAMSAMMMM